MFMYRKTQQINIQVEHGSYQTPSKIFCTYRKELSKIYMERQRNRTAKTIFLKKKKKRAKWEESI